MEDTWTGEVHKRLQKDERYLLWKKGADNIQEYLMLEMTERQRDLFVDFLGAQRMLCVYEVEHAHDIGIEQGMAEASKKKDSSS